MKMNRCAMFERLDTRQQVEHAIDACRRMKPSSLSKHHAAGKLGRLNRGEIQCGALPGGSACYRLPMNLNAPHPNAAPGGIDLDLLLRADAPRDERAGDHSSKA